MLKLVEPEGVTLTPLQLLAVILRAVLTDRITDEEVGRICTTYYDTVVREFSEPVTSPQDTTADL